MPYHNFLKDVTEHGCSDMELGAHEQSNVLKFIDVHMYSVGLVTLKK
jgi:hypothetical protein